MLAAAVFLVAGAVNLQLPQYASYATGAGLGAGAMSLLLAGYVGGLLPVLTLFGGISDRVGRKPVLLASLGSALVATLTTAIWPDAVGLGIARPLQGLAVALAMGSATAWVSEVVDAGGPARAARITGWATTAGFGAGAMATTALLWLEIPALVAYVSWSAALLITALAVLSLPSPATLDSGALIRLPTFPSGSAIPAASIGLGWSVAGIVVAVLPTTLPSMGAGGWSGVALFLLLGTGVAAQLFARTLTPSRAMAVGAAVLPFGCALLAAGVALQSLLVVLAAVMTIGSASHGFGYVGGLTQVSELPGSRSRSVSGYFLIAYLGFGLPAVAMGLAVDRLGPTSAYGWLFVVIAIGCLGLLRGSRRRAATETESGRF